MGLSGALRAELERIEAAAGLRLGVGVRDLGSGDTCCLHGDVPLPMASTYKVAIAARLLQRVDSGELTLAQMIDIGRDDLSPGGGILRAHFPEPGLALSVHNLLTIMLTLSDNTASDMVLDLAGGPSAVNAFLAAAGIEGMRVDRSTKLLITDAYGVTDQIPDVGWSHAFLREKAAAMKGMPPAAASAAFAADVRDTSTPEAMLALLEAIHRRAQLSESSAALLLGIMGRCETGAARLRAMLPGGTAVAHKTGTIPRVTINDVGILTLPDGAGQVAIAVFANSPTGALADEAAAERAIAHAARAAYDAALLAA